MEKYTEFIGKGEKEIGQENSFEEWRSGPN